MDAEGNCACHDRIDGFGVEGVDGESEALGYALDEVDEEMVAVNGGDNDCLGIKRCVGLVIDRNDIVAPLRGKANGGGTVALVNGHEGVVARIAESDNFLVGDGVADGTADEISLGALGEIVGDGFLGLVGDAAFEPVLAGLHFGIGEHLNDVATVETGLYRGEEVVYPGVAGMLSGLGRYFIGEIEDGGFLRHHDGFAMGGESHDVVVVERGDDLVDELCSGVVLTDNVADHVAELAYPALDVVFGAVGHTSELRVADHAAGTDVDLLPAAEVGEELHVEALVAVFFGRVDVIGDTSGFFLESGGQDGIYA